MKIKVTKKPELFLLGIDIKQIPKPDRTLAWYILAAARIILAKYWKIDKVPKTIEWLEKLIFFAEMDKITKKLRGQIDIEFKVDWLKLKNYIEKRWKPHISSWNLGNY